MGRRTSSLCMEIACQLTQLNTWKLVCSFFFFVFAFWLRPALCCSVSAFLLHLQTFLLTEQQDVHNFLLNNMANGGILDLMMRYLKAVGQKFTEEWPRGLTAVVLEVYQTWRKHSSGLPNPLLRDCSNQHIRVSVEKTT